MFLPSDAPESEFYMNHSIIIFEKRIPVNEVEELKCIEFPENIVKQLYKSEGLPEKQNKKEFNEWKTKMETLAVSRFWSV